MRNHLQFDELGVLGITTEVDSHEVRLPRLTILEPGHLVVRVLEQSTNFELIPR